MSYALSRQPSRIRGPAFRSNLLLSRRCSPGAWNVPPPIPWLDTAPGLSYLSSPANAARLILSSASHRSLERLDERCRPFLDSAFPAFL